MNRELFISDLKRFQRLYSAEELASKVADYVSENYIPKLSKSKAPDSSVEKQKIIELVCKHFSKSLDDIVKCRRHYRTIKPKKVLCFLLWKRTHMSLRDIANMFDYSDHTSVIHNRDSVLDLMRTDPSWAYEIEFLNEQLNEKNQPENMARVFPDDLVR